MVLVSCAKGLMVQLVWIVCPKGMQGQAQVTLIHFSMYTHPYKPTNKELEEASTSKALTQT